MSEKGKILIIEDNRANRILMVKVLSYNGFDVVEAETGRSGIEAANELLPDLVLLDLQLPDINGYQVAEALRADERTSNITVIAVTANVREEDREEAHRVGCVDFIEKPIDTRVLPDLISEYISSNGKEEDSFDR